MKIFQPLKDNFLDDFNSLPRVGIHPNCGHNLLCPQLVGAYSCDEITCKNCCSFTVLHLYTDQHLTIIERLFSEATPEEKNLLFWE